MRILDGLIAWSIQNLALALIGGLAVLVAGVWAGTHARLDALPDFTPLQVGSSPAGAWRTAACSST